MGLEIERKFLVDEQRVRDLEYLTEEKISQGYLSIQPPIVRVRLTNSSGYLTIKSSTKGISRQEFEYEIPYVDAEQLLQLCGNYVLEKYRRKIYHGGHIWEIDFFTGKHEGLILAEVELKSPDEFLTLPDWVRQEVSHDAKYFNSNLIKSKI